MKAHLLLLSFVAALCCPLSAPAQKATLADGLKAAVLRADDARVYAMLAADIGALDDMLAFDCLYVHSTGAVQTKAQLLGALRDGTIRYTAMRYLGAPRVRLYGNETAVLTGQMQIEVVLPDGKTLKPVLVITALYALLHERWQLVSYQSTSAPLGPTR
jgi:hypothetical protein